MKSTQPKPNSFLFPILNIPYHEAVSNGFNRLYTGNVEYEGKVAWGNYLYALFDKSKLSEEFLNKLLAHKLYIDYYYPTEEELMVIFEIPEKFKSGVIEPFLQGKYSEIDRSYVKTYFRKFTPQGQQSINWRILHRDPLLKQKWEETLGISLPEDAEVWSKPDVTEDIYKYEEQC